MERTGYKLEGEKTGQTLLKGSIQMLEQKKKISK